MKYKSPFLVIEDFLSPLTCESIVDTLGFGFPDIDAEGKPRKAMTFNRLIEMRLSDDLSDIIELTEQYYTTKIKGIHPLEFEWYPEGCPTSPPKCENSIILGGNWVRANNKDFVGVIFLNDYQETTPFDPDFEVRGGKLQFPTHGFGFNPKRGMLVIFPGNEYFVYGTSGVQVGNLHQIKMYMTSEKPFVYDPNDFPGNYEVWFR